jgi:uncharacterized protein YlaI
MCDKRGYLSVRAARQACRHASFRIRIYFCRECRRFVATAAEKR